jgi:hypothetical protein
LAMLNCCFMVLQKAWKSLAIFGGIEKGTCSL